MNRQIYTDRHGTEYALIKANRVNWVVERLSDQRRMKGNASIFTYVRTEQVEAPKVSPYLRPGALVNLKADCPLVKNGKAKEHDFYVILGFGEVPGEFKIIEVGGNDRNSYWRSIPGHTLMVDEG